MVYPALDSKVRNVTLAYSVEHEDEEHLFEQLFQLLSRALGEPEGREQLATVRLLACKVRRRSGGGRGHGRGGVEGPGCDAALFAPARFGCPDYVSTCGCCLLCRLI